MRVGELRSQHEEELGFRPEDAVRWLSPAELWRAGVKVVLSSVFASYADKREVQAGLAVPKLLRVAPTARDGDAGGDVWVDFVADLGDGFDATYTVASLLAADQLRPEGGDGTEVLPRGSLLVLGGDEVYPTASAREYENRMKGPYAAAFPRDRVAERDRPLMVVLPGNHDWYDGLTSFLRFFTQERPIGGWRTEQKRSYFAVQLPHRWWLLGLDSQFSNDLDEPQLQYFEQHVSAHLQPGDSVILCAATPTWVHTADEDPDAFNSLHWFDRHYVRERPDGSGGRVPTGAAVRLWITGDSHHYARFAEWLPGDPADPGDSPAQEADAEPSLRPDPRRRQMVVCGLGGAYLSASHRVPELLQLPPTTAKMREKDAPPLRFARAEVCYPDRRTSARWARRLAAPWSRYWLPRRNPGFGTIAAGVHLALFLTLGALLGLVSGRDPVSAVREATVGDALRLGSQVGVAVALALLAPWVLRSVRGSTWRPPSTAVAGVLLQVVVAGAAFVAAVAVIDRTWPGWVVVAAGCAWAAAVGWVLGSEAFAGYVLLARSGQVFGWQMSGQSVEDNKGFLRMRIDPTGRLTLFPLVVDEVCHDWAVDPDPRTHPEATSRRPVPARALPVPRLLEDPIEIDPATAAAARRTGSRVPGPDTTAAPRPPERQLRSTTEEGTVRA